MQRPSGTCRSRLNDNRFSIVTIRRPSPVVPPLRRQTALARKLRVLRLSGERNVCRRRFRDTESIKSDGHRREPYVRVDVYLELFNSMMQVHPVNLEHPPPSSPPPPPLSRTTPSAPRQSRSRVTTFPPSVNYHCK